MSVRGGWGRLLGSIQKGGTTDVARLASWLEPRLADAKTIGPLPRVLCHVGVVEGVCIHAGAMEHSVYKCKHSSYVIS